MHNSITQRTFVALVWQLLSRFGERGVRFSANIALARILSPDDFGVMAAVMAGLAAVEVVSFLATDQAILHSERGRTREFLSTVFWIVLVRGLVISTIMLAMSPLLARFFGARDATAMFALIAAQPLISGLANPKAQLLIRDLQFAGWAVTRVLATATGMSISILLALELRSPWALLIGQITTGAVTTIGSYFIAPFKPDWHWDRAAVKEIRHYALQAMGIPLLLVLIMQAPALLLGRTEGLSSLGIFTLNLTLAVLPVEFALSSLGTVAMPAYRELAEDPVRLAKAWCRVLSIVAVIVLPVGVALSWLDRDLPALVYGSQFVGATGLFAILAFVGVMAALIAVTGPLFWAIGAPALDRRVQIVRVVVLYGLGILLTLWWGSIGLAAAMCASHLCALGSAFHAARSRLGVSWSHVLAAVRAGGCSAVATGAALLVLGHFLRSAPWVFVILAGTAASIVVAASLAIHPASATIFRSLVPVRTVVDEQ